MPELSFDAMFASCLRSSFASCSRRAFSRWASCNATSRSCNTCHTDGCFQLLSDTRTPGRNLAKPLWITFSIKLKLFRVLDWQHSRNTKGLNTRNKQWGLFTITVGNSQTVAGTIYFVRYVQAWPKHSHFRYWTYCHLFGWATNPQRDQRDEESQLPLTLLLTSLCWAALRMRSLIASKSCHRYGESACRSILATNVSEIVKAHGTIHHIPAAIYSQTMRRTSQLARWILCLHQSILCLIPGWVNTARTTD